MKRKTGNFFWVLFIFAIIVSAVLIWIVRSNASFTETFYSLYNNKVETPIRAVLLSDLHQKEFDDGNGKLAARIQELKPDMILIAGDMVNKKDTDIAGCLSLCKNLAEIAPVYYGLGNHENEIVYGSELNREFFEKNEKLSEDKPENFTPIIVDDSLISGLEEAGVTVLQNESVTVRVKENQIDIGAVSTNLSSFWPYSGQFIYDFSYHNSEHFKILISHRPEPVMEYIPDYPVDLVVSGHNHGGIIRIPGRGGLLSVDEGLFPTYDEGIFQYDSLTMIVGRGLGSHGWIPRIFNKPELVVIDIN